MYDKFEEGNDDRLESVWRYVNTADGIVDISNAFIKHSKFYESTSYRSQVGSGVKDIYQNCFKPSAGPGPVNLSGLDCEASESLPEQDLSDYDSLEHTAQTQELEKL